MKLIGYLRVSTDRQAEEGQGLDVQEQAIRKWGRSNGHRLVALLRDEGVSGSNGLEGRMGLSDALGMLRDKEAEGLVVYRLDRLSRDLVIQETLLAELRKGEAHIFSTSAAEGAYLQDDPNDPSRKLIRQILGAVNEYERSIIALRLKSGRKRKHEKGGFAYGAPPFGYRAEGRELVPDEKEQAALKLIKRWRKEGKSLRAIAAALTSHGYKPARGENWHPKVIKSILDREGG